MRFIDRGAIVGCLTATLLILWSQDVAAQAAPVLSAEDRAWLDRSRQILRDAQSGAPAAWAKPPTPSPTALDAIKAARSAVPPWAQSGEGAPGRASSGRYIFVSLAMPEAELVAALAEASGQQAVVVIRGLAPGETVVSAGARLKRLAERLPADTPPPEVQLDPTAFTRFAVSVVPTLVVFAGDRELKVTGSLALSDLARRFAAGERGALARRGTTYPITERDFLEEIQSRIAKVDWEAQKRGAYQRFWQGQSFVELPVAERDAVRRFDPSVEVTRDVYAKNGQLVAKAGSRLNPQRVLPLRSVWFVFDPLDPRQTKRVAAEARALATRGRPFVLMATRLDRGREWDSLREVEDAFGIPISLANSELINRFAIRRLPSRIEADGDMLSVAELGVKQ